MVDLCSVAGCGRAIRARGWCITHYERWRICGDPQVEVPVHSPGKWDRTPEHNAANAAARIGKKASPETRVKMSASHRGKSCSYETRVKISEKKRSRDALLAIGFYIKNGYIILTGHQDHPLASRVGQVSEHRKVLYDRIGDGSHSCYWCGKILQWGGREGIQADHLDGDRKNNEITNLVVSCDSCNKSRARAGNPLQWSGL